MRALIENQGTPPLSGGFPDDRAAPTDYNEG